MLVLIGEKDELVLTWMGMSILDATKSPKGSPSIIIRDVPHENAWDQRQ